MVKSLDAAYLAKLNSQENQPRLLYELYLDSGTLYLADERDNVTFPTGGQVYTAIGIQHEAVQIGGNEIIDSVTISIDNVDKNLGRFVVHESFRGRQLIIKRVFADELGSASYDEIVFAGDMKEPTVDQFKIAVEATAGQPLLRLLPKHSYTRQCRWELGLPLTGPLESGKDIIGDTIDNDDGAPEGGSTTTLQDSDLTATANLYIEGKLECDFTDGTYTWTEIRRISAYDEGAKTITVPLPFSASTATALRWKATPGCDKTWNTCFDVFNNLLNFGGFVHVR